MDRDYISRHEHEEFRRSMVAENQRLEDENKRQNHRLDALGEANQQIHKPLCNEVLVSLYSPSMIYDNGASVGMTKTPNDAICQEYDALGIIFEGTAYRLLGLEDLKGVATVILDETLV